MNNILLGLWGLVLAVLFFVNPPVALGAAVITLVTGIANHYGKEDHH